MLISVITVTKNSASTIKRTVKSVASQMNVNFEHIIKDGNSVDLTKQIALETNPNIIFIQSSDSGIYDAMNQGYYHSSGKIIAYLNSDDYYIDSDVLSDVLLAFNNHDCDYVYANQRMVSLSGDVVREWIPGKIDCHQGLLGQQLPHPAFFVRRSAIDKLAQPFDPKLRIASDFKQQLLLINKMRLKGFYLNRTVVVVETGGESNNSLGSFIKGWIECVNSYNQVFGGGGVAFVIKKVLSKLKGVKLLNQIMHFGN